MKSLVIETYYFSIKLEWPTIILIYTYKDMFCFFILRLYPFVFNKIIEPYENGINDEHYVVATSGAAEVKEDYKKLKYVSFFRKNYPLKKKWFTRV